MTQLSDLLARVEVAEGPDRELDGALGFALGYFPRNRDHYEWIEVDGTFVQSVNPKSFTASLDAALALVERVLPGWFKGVQESRNVPGETRWAAYITPPMPADDEFDGHAPSAPLALLAALLKALIASTASPAERQPQPRDDL